MGIAPTPVLVSATGIGNSADGKITRDSIDDLIGAMQSHLLIYLRAVKITPANASFVDALGNTVTAQTSGVTKNSSDANFNNHSSITLNDANNQYAMAAGGIGIGTPPIAMPNSFTVLAGLRSASSFAGVSSCLYGDGTNANGGVALYVGTSGNLVAQVNGSAELSVASAFATSTTYAFWYSYDAATKIHRYGMNNTTVLAQATGAQNRTSQGASTVCYPFGYYSSGTCGYWSFNRWALFGKAYMNGAVPSDDAAFTNLVANYAAYI